MLTLSFLLRFGADPFLVPKATNTGRFFAHLSPHTKPAIRKLISLAVTLQPFVLSATLVGEFRDDRLVVFVSQDTLIYPHKLYYFNFLYVL